MTFNFKLIRSKRRAIEMTQQELADKAKRSIGWVAQMERGKTADIMIGDLDKVCRALDLDINDVFYFGGQK